MKSIESKAEIKANTNTTTLLLTVALFIIVLIVGYVFFNDNKDLNDIGNQSRVTSEEEPRTNDVKEIDLNFKEKLVAKIDRELRDIEIGIQESYGFPSKEYTGNDVKLELENGTLKYTFNDKIFTIDNVKTLKTDHVTYESLLFAITNDNEVWYCNIGFDAYIKKLDDIPTFKKLTGKYKDVKMLHIAYSGDSDTRDYLLVDENNKYYTLNEKLYDETLFEQLNYEHYDVMKSYITTTGDIYYNNEKTDIKYKLGIYDVYSEDISYIISTDNYLYQDNLEKYSLSKIEKILYNEFQHSFEIVFEDGTKLSRNYALIKLNK